MAPEWCVVPARAGPAQVELVAAVGAEHVGHGVEQRAQLRVAILVVLDGLGVEPERDVVDEHAPVDLGEVHDPLAAVDERVQGADDVVAVDAEVEREVVARAGGDARVGQAALGRDRRDDRLRAVAAGHRERRRRRARRAPRTSASRSSAAARARSARSPRLRASSASLKRSALPPPDFGLKNSTGRCGGSAPGRSTWTVSVCRAAASVTTQPDDDEQIHARRTTEDEDHHGADQGDRGDGEARRPRDAAPQRAVPGATPATSTQPSRIRPRGTRSPRHDDREDDGGRSDDQRDGRGQPPAHQPAPSTAAIGPPHVAQGSVQDHRAAVDPPRHRPDGVRSQRGSHAVRTMPRRRGRGSMTLRQAVRPSPDPPEKGATDGNRLTDPGPAHAQTREQARAEARAAPDARRAGGQGQGGASGGPAVRARRMGSRRAIGAIPSSCWRSRRRPASPSWCRSATGGCWCRRSRSTAARPTRWRPTWPTRPGPGWTCSSAATRICRTSARSPRPTGGSCSASTTSTRRCRARSSGTSSGSSRASPWPAAIEASTPSSGGRSTGR